MAVAALLPSPRELLAKAVAAKSRNDWDAIAALIQSVPAPLDSSWLALVDEIAFALGQMHRTAEAVALLEAAFSLEPTWRRASALAYLHYDGSLSLMRPGSQESGMGKEALRKGFRRWIGEALLREPHSIKDLYRLGVFEAQVESRHDAPALRAFLHAIDSYQQMPEGDRGYRGDLRKVYCKALYAGGRSALRLGNIPMARKLSFACIREDKPTDHVEPVHKMHLAARVCLASGELDHAERAARLALDGDGPPRRDYLFGLLCDIALQRGDPKAAAAWIEQHVQPHRRDSSLWRRLGDARRADGALEAACGAYDSALRKDRCGRHLTLVRLGAIYLEQKRLGQAEDAFRKAAEFRRSRYLSDDPEALAGLEKVLEARGKTVERDRIHARLAKATLREDPRDQPMDRAAGDGFGGER